MSALRRLAFGVLALGGFVIGLRSLARGRLARAAASGAGAPRLRDGVAGADRLAASLRETLGGDPRRGP